MKKSLVLFLSIFFVQYTEAAAPPVVDYAYEQKITSVFEDNTLVEVDLNAEILRQNDPDFSQLQLATTDNEPVEFTLYDLEAKQVDTLETFKVSSAKEGFSPVNLLDDNRLTEYAFDQKVDGAEASWVWVDFGKVVNLHRLEIFKTDRANVPGYQLRGGLREDNLRTIKRKTAFQTYTDLDFPPLRYLEIKFWGNNVKLEDINFYQKSEAKLYFEAKNADRYRILFGNPEIESKRYAQRISEPLAEKTTLARLGKINFNPLFPDDIDDDKVKNDEDNCPFIPNKSQKDRDSDLFGDACDNAINVKNYSQTDVDRDGVGDQVDNCKLVKNPNQNDKDRDGRGNVCDTNAFDQGDSSATAKNSKTSLFWLGLILASIIGIGAFIIGSKQKK